MPHPSVFFRLHPSLQQVLHSTLRWKELRNIQEQAYEPVISGCHVLLMARTAGGKSEAAFFPVIDQILKSESEFPFCLYISPLRALISDLALRLDCILAPLHLSSMQVHGDAPQAESLYPDPPAFIMTTPESLTVLFYEGMAPELLDRVRVCIIDEVHALAGSERGAQLMAVLSLLESRSGHEIQRIGLSATIGNPGEIMTWMNRENRPAQVIQAEPEPIPREFIFLTGWDGGEKQQLVSLIRGKRSLIFARSRNEAEFLSGLLEPSGLPISVHHSSLSSDSRREAEGIFLRNPEGTIICTSTLELGIDVGTLDLVVQSGPLMSISSFLQRLGRVGRRGNTGTMAFLVKDAYETLLVAAAISAAAAGMVEPVIPVRYPYRAIVQQVILPLLQKGRCSVRDLESRLSLITPSLVPRDRIRLILSNLVEQGLVLSDRGYLMPGPALEMWVHQRGVLYSVIGEGSLCEIRTPNGDPVGNLPVTSADLVRSRPFSLGGKSWNPSGLGSDSGILEVSPGSFPADPPVFRGSSPGMSPTLLREVATIIRSGLPDLSFPDQVHLAVQKIAETYPPECGPDTVIITREDDRILVYSFLGEVWNRMIGQYIREQHRREFSHSLKMGFNGVSLWFSSSHIGPEWVREEFYSLMNQDPGESYGWVSARHNPARVYDQFLPEICLQEMICRDWFRWDLLVDTLARSRIHIPR